MSAIGFGPWSYKIVRGAPIEVRNCRLIPLARLFRIGRSKARISQENAECYGAQWVSIAPAAVVIHRPGERQLLPIIDLTNMVLLGFALVSFAVYAGYRTVSRLLEEHA